MTFGACTVHCIHAIKPHVKQASGESVIPAKKMKWLCVHECFCKSLKK